jgi:hypothetical protein
MTGTILFLTSHDAAFITGNCRGRRSVSDRLERPTGRFTEGRQLCCNSDVAFCHEQFGSRAGVSRNSLNSIILRIRFRPWLMIGSFDTAEKALVMDEN